MGLSRTISETNGDFGRKSQNFSNPRVFCAPLTEFLLKLGIGAQSQKTGVMGLPGGRKRFKIGLYV